MNKLTRHIFLIGFVTFFTSNIAFSQTQQQDSVTVRKDSIDLPYNFNRNQDGGLYLNTLAEKEIIFDKELNRYVIIESIGDYQTKTPIYLTRKEYEQYRLKRDMLLYFKEKVGATNSKKKGAADAQKNLLPTYYVNNKFFETIFGGNEVVVTPTGNLNLKLGFIYQNTENPQITEENRSSLVFDFDQQINTSLRANIGERLEFTANYDTQSTFDFQNLVKIDYTPTEDDILQSIEAGNVSMPIKNSLINGAQSLFGVKAQLKFGNTNVTAIYSQQNSESNTVVSEGGSSVQSFELRTTDYDNDRHFFLSQYFVDNYASSLSRYPLISSQVNITRIEVWITNRNSSTEDYRNIVALADLGESENDNLVNTTSVVATNPPTVSGGNLPTNDSNNLGDLLTETSGIRNLSTLRATLPADFDEGTDYSVLENAQQLQSTEYTLNSQLGFISLNRRLNDGEVLAVAYEYTVAGNVSGSTEKSFRVGEFSNDGIQSPNTLAVKLLRSEILQTKKKENGVSIEEAFPIWRLMMKNIYALGAYPLTQDGFRFEIQYRDDETGVATNVLQRAATTDIANTPLIQVLNLDQLDQTQFRDPDGFFDYVEGVTVNSQNGYIIFPTPEPFGNNLADKLDESVDSEFIFEELYLNVKVNAQVNFQDKDKYLLTGYFTSEDSGGISIGAFNVPRGSVTVTANGRQLVEGIDYVVDYNLGRVEIIDAALKASDTPISVSTENNAVFNQQRKRFMGVDVEHTFSENFILGATVLNVNERPLTPKVNYGSDPINNTMFGMNLDYSAEAPILTKLANKLPFVDTDAPSSFSVRADFAYLLPGTPSGIDVAGAATTYLDDFEASQIPISLISPLDWYEASTPNTTTFPDFGGDLNENLAYNYKRSKLAWYSIDQIFYGFGDTPDAINADDLSRAETAQLNYNDLFPNQEFDITQNTQIRTLDLAYFPNERGSYNYDTSNVNASDGTFTDPEDRWGGIMRSLTTNNFDQANVEYIQFWVMDPYQNYSITNEEGLPLGVDPTNPTNQVGDLYFNLGNISEDILKDSRKMYENGLPEIGGEQNTQETVWGKVPTNSSIIYAFDEDDDSRTNQDLGFDGLNDDDEVDNLVEQLNLNSAAQLPSYFLDDPASDNFRFFRGGDFETESASIISRYKDYNNTQGNSPTLNQSTESFPTSSTSYPDVEDVNKDQTMNSIESFYEYKVSMNQADLQVGTNFIVDERNIQLDLDNGDEITTKWYQFRVPINSGVAQNGIDNFNSIRFIRMFMTNFRMPVVLRFAELDLVRGDWRRYTQTLELTNTTQEDLDDTEIENFEVGVVNIEENPNRYVTPPGIDREALQGSTTVQLQNEQSVTLSVTDLPSQEIRAIYKNLASDLRRFKNLEMFIHLESNDDEQLSTNDFTAIVRLGTDLDDNFYQIEIPLTPSANSLVPLEVWPEENNLDTFLEELGQLKLERDIAGLALTSLYPLPEENEDSERRIRVKGNPTLAELRTVMLGLKNNTATPKSGEVWFNELRASDFDNDGGWAAVVNADANFADVANVSVSGSIQTFGFGNVEDRAVQRSFDETKQYDIATSINLGKVFTPERWGIQIPMSYTLGEVFIDPLYDPQYQDVLLEDALESNEFSQFSRDYTKRSSISFNNVRKNRNPQSSKKPRFYDVENIALSYSHNKEFRRDYNIEKYLNESVNAGASYSFSFDSKPLEPFKDSELLKSKYLKLIKDFNINLIPSTIAVNSNINRSYNEQQTRNLISDLSEQPTLTQRRFLFDWDYTLALDLTKSIQVNFNATNSNIYDAFDSDEELAVFDNFFNTGRPNQYHQTLQGNYNIPINKIPFLKFIKADYAYTADFDWQTQSQDPDIIQEIGNIVQNANTHSLNTTLNLETFYKGFGFEKWLNSTSAERKAKRENTKLAKTNSKGGANKAFGLPRTPSVVKKKKKIPLAKKIVKGVYDVATSVKNAKFSYSQNNGQLLSGFEEEVNFLGGPSTGFAFGSQVDIRNKALENGWLVNPRALNDDPDTDDIDESTYYSKNYNRTSYEKLDYSFTVKPVKDLSIEVRGNKIETNDVSQQIDIVEDSSRQFGSFDEIDPFETGNFSTSFFMANTMFTDGDELFNDLLNYRSIISERLARENLAPDADNGFGEDSQQVLLPAFIAAYTGKDPEKVNTNLFRDIPLPNWNVRYSGLMKLKWFKKNFSSFAISHAYRSSYTVSTYTNNLLYDESDPFALTEGATNFEPRLLASAITLVDEFSPLVQVDMKMKNSFSLRGEVRKDRTLTMNFNNSTLTDVNGIEYVFGLGYVFKDVKVNTRFTGKKQTLKGDINLRADVSLRDNITQIRAIEENNNQISGGQRLFSIKFTADYMLSRSLTASFYYNHQATSYAISTTFPRQSINGGVNIIYNLGGN
ncbi:cell surface protein SprA [Polaribacter sp.]|nr:cell surface protein SprA [Polaribacter sp.]